MLAPRFNVGKFANNAIDAKLCERARPGHPHKWVACRKAPQKRGALAPAYSPTGGTGALFGVDKYPVIWFLLSIEFTTISKSCGCLPL